MLLCAKHSTSISSWKCLWEMFSTNAFGEIYYGSSRISRMSLETVWRLLRIATSTKFNPKPCLLQNRHAASLVFIARVCPLESTSCFGRLPHVVERGKNLESRSGMVAPLTLIGRVSKTPSPNIYKALSPTCSWPGCVIMASVLLWLKEIRLPPLLYLLQLFEMEVLH